jgi:leucine dehydrogenase
MSLFEILSRIGTMELHSFHDRDTGLRALAAIHDTRLGPSVGGTRVFAYASEDEAIFDVVRLARGMTYKAALAGLAHGGGKAVIWTDGKPIADRTALFRAFGRFVDGLGGRYVTCEDSGTSPADIDVVKSVTKHCLGGSIESGGSGDPSPFTALGVRRGIEAIAHVVLGRQDLKGLHVAIQGVGHVGYPLARELAALGARLTVADIDAARAERCAREFGAELRTVQDIVATECDVYAPCALGGAINDATIDRLRCQVVAGAANNQLQTPEMGRVLQARKIFYAPDYAINAGGLINVAEEFKGYDVEAATAKTMAIYDTIAELAARSLRTGALTAEMADRMVEEILARTAQPASTAAMRSSPSSSRVSGTAV